MNSILTTTGMILASFIAQPQASTLPSQLPPPPEVAPADPDMIDHFEDTLSAGYGETVMLNQCFNLVDGQVTACFHQHADFKYTYSANAGGNLLPRHDFRLGASREDMPSLQSCRTADFYDLSLQLPLPAESLTGRYYCFETEFDGDTVYGWIQPTSFNSGGITFNYHTYEATDALAGATADAQIDIWAFTQNHESGRTILDGQCFDFSESGVVSCWTGEPDFRYNYQEWYGGIIESRPAAQFSSAVVEIPSKASCQAASYFNETAITFETNPPGIYVCFQVEYDGELVFGWMHPTRFNEGGMTFDYAIYIP
ncbi:MAG: hypothetical protein JXA97_03365 [Anaerolineales bacterium]|nr:hypothetical protein [Anaerolineales bacterium]